MIEVRAHNLDHHFVCRRPESAGYSGLDLANLLRKFIGENLMAEIGAFNLEAIKHEDHTMFG